MKLSDSIPVLSYGAEALVPFTHEVKDLLTQVDAFGETYVMYRLDTHDSKNAWVPRGLVRRPKENVYVTVHPVSPTVMKVPPLNQDQARCIAESTKLTLAGFDHVVESPTGSGKTAIAVAVAGALGQKTLIVVTKNDLVKSWRDTLVHLFGVPLSEIGHVQQNIVNYKGCKFVIAMIHSLVGDREYPPDFYQGFGLTVYDECFPAGTLVGSRPIEAYVVGDTVDTVLPDGSIRASVVTATTSKQGEWFARVSHGCGALVSTTTQPVFVEGLGFVPAALLLKGDYVLRQMSKSSISPVQEHQGAVQKRDAGILLQNPRRVVEIREYVESNGAKVSGVEQAPLVKEGDREQPDGAISYTPESVQGPQGETVSCSEGWERARPDSTATATVGRFGGFISASGTSDWSVASLQAWATSELRNGHCNSESEAMHRIRRAFAQHFEGKGVRLEKGLVLEKSRVEGVEIQKRDRAIELGWGIGTGEVYNLEVAHTHNYFANGVLVHNCHHLAADTFSRACRLFPTKHRLGLSATPKRSDGKQRLFHAHIGPISVVGNWVPMRPKVLVKMTGWKPPLVSQRDDSGQWVKSPMKVVPGRTMPVLKAIASHLPRNLEIAHFVKSAVDSERIVLILSDLIEGHLEPLFHFIVSAGVPGNMIGYYHGGISKNELEASKMKSVVLATYAMAGEGTNVPRWDSLVLATPRANVKQAVGRVLRYVEGKKQPVVLDLVDDQQVLKGFHFARLKTYFSLGAEVINL